MGDGGMVSLRRALERSGGDHLDDEALAALATAEAAGDDVEALFPAAVAHVEACVSCAQAYGDLVQLMVEAVDEMAAAARSASPQEVYAALLACQLAGEELVQDVPGVAERAAAGLPALFTEPPSAREEVTPGLVAAALAADEGDEDAEAVAKRVTAAVREQFSALILYLQGAAQNVWERALAVQAEVGGRRREAALRWGPVASLVREAPPEYGAEEAAKPADEEEGRLPLTLRAVRLSALACRLEVQVETMAGGVAGVVVHIDLPGREEVATTDEAGLATFAPVPIAALPHLLVRVGEA